MPDLRPRTEAIRNIVFAALWGSIVFSAAQSSATERKYLTPAFHWGQGFGNQFIEFQASAAIAKLLNRTLCLSPFAVAQKRHENSEARNHRAAKNTLFIGEIGENFDTTLLKRFVDVEELDQCQVACGGHIDAAWALRDVGYSTYSFTQWSPESVPVQTFDFATSSHWNSPANVVSILKNHTEACAALIRAFPGLRWRGAYLATAQFMTPSAILRSAAKRLQKAAFNSEEVPFVAVHWRFDESRCRKGDNGLCFLRCANGAEPDEPTVSVSEAEWKMAMLRNPCPVNNKRFGVLVSTEDLIAAILERASNVSSSHVYIATDAWLRDGCGTLQVVVDGLRQRNITVAGTWICNFPSFADGTSPTVHSLSSILLSNDKMLSNRMLSRIEQTLATQADIFMGSGQSTWSLAVARSRMASRMSAKIVQSLTLPRGYKASDWPQVANKEVDEQVIQQLLYDDLEAATYCLYHLEQRYESRHEETAHTWHGEDGKDIWLDFAACEGMLQKGGTCKIPYCH